MRPLPALAVATLLTGCGTTLDPALALREASRQLRCSISSVQARLEPRLPLERSLLRVELTLKVENPSRYNLPIQAIQGALTLDQEGHAYPLAEVASRTPLDLPPGATGTTRLELQATYADLKTAWEPLSRTLLQRQPGAWRLKGSATIHLLGVPVQIPFTSTQEAGT